MSKFNFEDLDNDQLLQAHTYLIAGMETFSERNKIKYAEAWANRKERLKELNAEIERRGLNVECLNTIS